MMKSVYGAFACCVLATTPLVAQANPDSVHARNDCRLGSQVIRDGQPADKLQWALRIAPTCGADFAFAAASRFNTDRQSSYADVLGRIADETFYVRDASLLDAVLAVAKDPGASRDARLMALRTAVWQVSKAPLWGRFETIATGAPYDGSYRCPALPLTDVVISAGAPVSTDQVSRAEALGDDLARDGNAPPDVRRMGACLSSTARHNLDH